MIVLPSIVITSAYMTSKYNEAHRKHLIAKERVHERVAKFSNRTNS